MRRNAYIHSTTTQVPAHGMTGQGWWQSAGHMILLRIEFVPRSHLSRVPLFFIPSQILDNVTQ